MRDFSTQTAFNTRQLTFLTLCAITLILITTTPGCGPSVYSTADKSVFEVHVVREYDNGSEYDWGSELRKTIREFMSSNKAFKSYAIKTFYESSSPKLYYIGRVPMWTKTTTRRYLVKFSE
jgi:hypothetical protein